MSISASLSLGQSASRRRIELRRPAPVSLPLDAWLMRAGGVTATASLLAGLVLFRCGALTLFWIKILPIPTLSGLATVSLGVVILCLRTLRDMPEDSICQTPRGYRS